MFELDRCAVIGMVHLHALPGSPGWGGDLDAVLAQALADASALQGGGVDALIVENMGDVPYERGRIDPAGLAAAAVVTREVAALGLPTGIQLLAGANVEALAAAVAAGASFVRAEAFAYAHVADEGWLEASAATLLRIRKNLGAEVEFWADVQKKHAAHAVTGDLPLGDLARGHAFCGADALVVTGRHTGEATALEDVRAAKVAGLPVVVGSGVTPGDAATLAREADALIVGSYFKRDGDWREPVDPQRVSELVASLGR
ncbi:MAG: BtpA/SgcQ family protein [Planctomycetes bacterium]|nr:BtpA/SgcQ family protein [Planctomycetota bacterium]